MGKDKLTNFLRDYIFEGMGRNALLRNEAEKLVRMLKRDFANKEIGHFFYGEELPEYIRLLKPYLPFRFNIQHSHDVDFGIRKFDSNGNVVEVTYHFGNNSEPIKLKSPLDIFNYFLNLRDKLGNVMTSGYSKLMDFAAHSEASKETREFGREFYELIKKTKDTGDELGRDDVSGTNLYPDKPFKEKWIEDYVTDDGDDVKSIEQIQYKLPGSKRITQRSKELTWGGE